MSIFSLVPCTPEIILEKPDIVKVIERAAPVTRGVVEEHPTQKYLKIRQFTPNRPETTPWLEHVWTVEWDLPHGCEHIQRTVPFPVFNLVADQRKGCNLHGCTSSSFEYPLKGRGQVVGFRFKPAAQSVFYPNAASDLTDNSTPANSLLSVGAEGLLIELAKTAVSGECIAKCLTVLNHEASTVSPAALSVQKIVKYVEKQLHVFRVRDIAEAFQLSERALQRHFNSHLGVSPKLVIERFRIHNALSACKSGSSVDFAQLALRLGYFDQSHFTNAFKRVVGISPAEYTAQCTMYLSSE